MDQYRPANRLFLSWLRCCASPRALNRQRHSFMSKSQGALSFGRLWMKCREQSTGLPNRARGLDRALILASAAKALRLKRQAFPCPAQGASSRVEHGTRKGPFRHLHLGENRFPLTSFSHACPEYLISITHHLCHSFSHRYRYRYCYCYHRLSSSLILTPLGHLLCAANCIRSSLYLGS